MLQPVAFSYEQCLKEAQELQAFLGSHQSLRERDEILPFFKARRHLSAFLGVCNYHTITYDRLVVGRREDFGPRERDRVNWRQRHVDVNGNKIHCITFDDLCEEALSRLATYPLLRKALKGDEQGQGTEGATAAKPAPAEGPDSAPKGP
jgi:hypothetical protein